jgi:hypothetical protein
LDDEDWDKECAQGAFKNVRSKQAMNMPLEDKPPVPTCEEVISFGSPGM